MFKDLVVWQKAMKLVRDVYSVTKSFPADERAVLTDQFRRAVVSIPSNIGIGAPKSGTANRTVAASATGAGKRVRPLPRLSRRPRQYGFVRLANAPSPTLRQCQTVTQLLWGEKVDEVGGRVDGGGGMQYNTHYHNLNYLSLEAYEVLR